MRFFQDNADLIGGPERCPVAPGSQRRLYWAGVLALLLLAFACRLYLAVNMIRVEHDSAGYYLPIAEAIQLGTPLPARHVNVPVLLPWLNGQLARARIFGDIEFSARVVSMAGGMAMCVGVFLLARTLFGPYAAVVALALAAFNPYQCRIGAETGLHAAATGCFALLAFCLVSYLRTPRWRKALALGAAASLMALVRAEGFVYVFAALGLMWVFPSPSGPGRMLRRTGHVAAALLLAVLICIPRLAQVHRETGFWVLDTRQVTQVSYVIGKFKVSDASEAVRVLATGRRAARTEWPVMRTVDQLSGAFGPASVFFGLVALTMRRRRMRLEWPAAILIVLGLATVVTGSVAKRVYFMPMGAVWQIWAGVGLLTMLRALATGPIGRRWAGKAWLNGVPCVVVLAAVAGMSQAGYVFAQGPGDEQLTERAAGEWMRATYGPNQRMLMDRSYVAWHARADRAWLPPRGKPALEWNGEQLANYAREQGCRFVVADTGVGRWCPIFFKELESGEPAWGRVVYDKGEGEDRVRVIELHPSY